MAHQQLLNVMYHLQVIPNLDFPIPDLKHDYVYEINWSRFGNVTMEKWKKKKIVLEDKVTYEWVSTMIKYKSQQGLTLLEALVSTAIVGIGFVAIFSMVNFSVQSIDSSAERNESKLFGKHDSRRYYWS